MRKTVMLTLLAVFLLTSGLFAQSDKYYPTKWKWETRTPEQVGMDAAKIKEVTDFAMANSYTGLTDMKMQVELSFSHEPFNSVVGPTKERGGPSGLIIKDGYIIAEWGTPDRVDMTFSATKSYLSTTAGLALDEGLIEDVHDPMYKYIWDGKFDSDHNRKIEWHHLLNQSSDWYGMLFDKWDWADRPSADVPRNEWPNRELHEPDTYFKYNDVRVNLLSFSLLNVWRRPLPMVLKEKIMDPIGASNTWRWYGYSNTWALIDGVNMQSVSGGGHRGGGFFINSYDHGRFGLLFLRDGNWKGKQLISKEWIDMIRVPSKANPSYGYMWWLNTDKKQIPSAPESVYFAAGFGGNYIVIDDTNDLVVVTRWVGTRKNINGIMKRVYEAIK